MKKSNIAMLIIFFVCIPFTLYMGRFFSGRAYYITSTLIIVEVLLPFVLAFEGRKPQARELVVIAVMCAIAVVARVAIPIPHFKPAFASLVGLNESFVKESIKLALNITFKNFFKIFRR